MFPPRGRKSLQQPNEKSDGRVAFMYVPADDILQYGTFTRRLSTDHRDLWERQCQSGIHRREDMLQLIDHWN